MKNFESCNLRRITTELYLKQKWALFVFIGNLQDSGNTVHLSACLGFIMWYTPDKLELSKISNINTRGLAPCVVAHTCHCETSW